MEPVEQQSWWVLRAQSGDKEALDKLFQSIQAPLYRYILGLVGEQHISEDVLQEVFIRIYRKLRWLREPEMFRSWAYRIATNESFRRIKQERRWRDQIRDEELLEAIPSPSQERFAPEVIDQIPDLVAAISPASRAVITLFYLHEMPLGEIAAVLGVPLGTVKSRLAHGLRRLRQQVKKPTA